MKRKHIFCSCCCENCYEIVDNSWGSFGAYYKCRLSDHYKTSMSQWDELELPPECALKLEYSTFTDEAMEYAWRVGHYEKAVDECQNNIDEYEEKIKVLKIEQKEYQDKADNNRKKLTDI